MESQNPAEWQLLISQLPVDPDQPSTSRRHTRDEAGLSGHQVQPQTKLGIQQFSLPILQLENKALIIVLEFEPTLSESYQIVFEGCFEKNVEE